MGWEQRGKRWYFYTKTKRGGHVVSSYIGTGEIARLAAHLDYLNQAERAEAAAAWQRERDHDRDLERAIAQQHRRIMALARANLLINGCHTHKGQWRKARE